MNSEPFYHILALLVITVVLTLKAAAYWWDRPKPEETPLEILERSGWGWIIRTCDAGYECRIFNKGSGGYLPPWVGGTGRTINAAIENAMRAIPDKGAL